MPKKFINIQFPFKESENGFFLKLTDNDDDAVKSDLIHLLLSRKGSRLYNPNFGTKLLKHIFEPNDGVTFGDLKLEITETVSYYLPQLLITNIQIDRFIDSPHAAKVRVDYTLTTEFYEARDFVEILL